MKAAFLPGASQVVLQDVPKPAPGYGQVLLAMKASTICGSDLRAIYREHLGEGPEAYQDVVAGHEPAGQVVELGPGVRERQVGDRVAVYHISGCGICDDCRMGYQISCTSGQYRRAYGWQRDGGHEDFLVADERDLVPLPDSLTYLDGACAACGFGTAYEALCRLDVSGRDRLLITGLGPVGLAAGLLAKRMGVRQIIGTDPVASRRDLAVSLGAVDHASGGTQAELTALLGDGADAAIDCSGNGTAQAAAIHRTRRWGRVALVGEGGIVNGIDVSAEIIHKQLVIHGSWVTSTQRMAELLQRCAAWGLHPEVVVTDRFPLDQAAVAYQTADAGLAGKVGIVWAG
ncbi:MAG: zinc-binding dehydrogenase [Bifidobacteriaceae bacterium]|jgi:threonine dehydrogenase-like Zn-dependent dehydrogenase|nr:zinc-binding dehydrogenase [Bifidobacteriaceae bacterium]